MLLHFILLLKEMEALIKNKITELEKEKGIKVLLACETGSRAWGFPSPDSDFDIRLIYVHSPEWYISVYDKKDTIEMMIEEGDLDISGWELKKTLGLLFKSNAALLERIQSPILYKAEPDFIVDMEKLAEKLYSPKAVMHHYLSMSSNFVEEIGDAYELKLKKLFYALRTAVACQWVLQKDIYPPIEFTKMLDELEIDRKIRDRAFELIELKMTKKEDYRHPREEDIIEFVRETIELSKAKFDKLGVSIKEKADLDSVLRKWVGI